MAALCVNRDKRNLENGGRWAVLTALAKALGLAWSESSAFAVLMCIARVASGVMPLGVLWAGKTIIDRIQETRAVDVATSQSSSIELLAAPIVAYVALTVGREVAKACATLSSEVMASRILGRANIMLMEKLIQHPGLEPFEDYRARDALHNARAGIATRPVEVVESCLGALETISACIGAAAVLWHVHPVAMLLVAAVALPSVMVEAELFKRLVKVFADHAGGLPDVSLPRPSADYPRRGTGDSPLRARADSSQSIPTVVRTHGEAGNGSDEDLRMEEFCGRGG